MNAYEVANNSKSNRADKVAAITAVADLTPELEWLLSFTQLESEACAIFCFFDINLLTKELTKLLWFDLCVL